MEVAKKGGKGNKRTEGSGTGNFCLLAPGVEEGGKKKKRENYRLSYLDKKKVKYTWRSLRVQHK